MVTQIGKIMKRGRYIVHDNCIAYFAWVQSLNKSGFPKNKNGTSMSCGQLYNHWLLNIDKRPWLNYAKRMRA